MSTLSELWADYVKKNPSAANNPVPFQTPRVVPEIPKSSTINKPIFNAAAAPAVDTKAIDNSLSKYKNPATGQLFTPQEYANYVASKIPTQNADVGTYAGGQITNPKQTEAELVSSARQMNNARNDMAVGQTDPYKVATQSGIPYSPAELKAIENAYAGVYDPAINDVMAKLDAKQKEEAKKEEDRLWKERQIFATNESIRQWKATTGTKSSDTPNQFTKTQLNTGASNSGLTIDAFSKLDPDLQNFYVNSPTELNPETNKQVPMYETFTNLVAGANKGAITSKEAADEIEGSPLPESVKHYFLDQLTNLPVVEKEGYFSRIWSAIKGQ